MNSTNGAPAGAQAPAKAPTVALKAITLAAWLALDLNQQDAVLKGYAKRFEKNQDDRNDIKIESKNLAIALAGMEKRVQNAIAAGVEASTFTVSALYERVTGQKAPGHVWTLKASYVYYVMGVKDAQGNVVIEGKVTEAEWLRNKNNCLELAARIADACIEFFPSEGLKHDAVSRAATELKTRDADNEAKNLREILASVKPVKVLDAKEALDLVEEIIRAGHFAAGLAHAVDVIAGAKNAEGIVTIAPVSERLQQEAYVAWANKLPMLETALGDRVETWLKQANAMQPETPVGVTNGDAAANPDAQPPAAPETDDAAAPAEQDEEPAELVAN